MWKNEESGKKKKRRIHELAISMPTDILPISLSQKGRGVGWAWGMFGFCKNGLIKVGRSPGEHRDSFFPILLNESRRQEREGKKDEKKPKKIMEKEGRKEKAGTVLRPTLVFYFGSAQAGLP